MAEERSGQERPDESVAELFSRLTQEISDLVNTHLQLARVEIISDLRHAGAGVGLMGGAGVAAYVAAFLASVAGALGLGELMPMWAGFLLVAAGWAVVALVLALVGRRRLKDAPVSAAGILQELERDRAWMRRRSL